MAATAWMLELTRTSWCLHISRADAAATIVEHDFAESELVDQVASIREALAVSDYGDEPIVVALHATWCHCATLPIDHPRELRDRQTLLYRLEECIPWNAEECVGDYLASGGRVFMAAAPTVPLADFFGRLEECGVQIQSIVPTALLACAEHLSLKEWPASHSIVMESNGWIDLVGVEASKPIHWAAFPAACAALTYELKKLSLDSGIVMPIVGYGLNSTMMDSLAACEAATLVEKEGAADENGSTLALAASGRILHGQMEAPLELKRGPFGRSRRSAALRRYTTALKTALIIMMVSAVGTFLYRGRVLSQKTDQMAAQQSDVFRQVFPNVKVPTGIKSRLESEVAKLKGIQGEDETISPKASATTLLHTVLAAMPTDRRFRLLEVRIEEGRVFLNGEVRAHGDAEAIAQRLRAGGLDVASPKTQRLDDQRVSLHITGSLILASTRPTKKSL